MWIYLKLVRRYNRFPRLLAMVADRRRSYEDRARVAKTWWSCSGHDLDPGFCLLLKGRLGDWRELFKPEYQELLYWWARAFRLHSQRSEFKHSSNRHHTTGSSDYMHFVSRSWNQHAVQTILREKPEAYIASAPAGVAPSDAPGGPVRSFRMRWHNTCCRRDGCASFSSWAAHMEEWESLSEDHQASFIEWHKAELDREVSARRLTASLDALALVPVVGSVQSSSSHGTSLICTPCGPSGEGVSAEAHILGGGITAPVDANMRTEYTSRLQHLPMHSGRLKGTMAESNVSSMKAAAKIVDSMATLPLARDMGSVPAKVKLFRPCLGVCVRKADNISRVRRATCKNIEQAMQDMVKSSGHAPDMLQKLFVLEKFVEGQERASFHLLMPAAHVRNGKAEIWTPTLAALCFKPMPESLEEDDGSLEDFTNVRCIMERGVHTARCEEDKHYAVLSKGVDVGPVSVCITGEWLPDHVLAHDDAAGFSCRLVVGRLRFSWSDTAPDCIVLQGRHAGDKVLEVDFSKPPKRTRHEGIGSDDDDDGDDVPDFSSMFNPPSAPSPRPDGNVDDDQTEAEFDGVADVPPEMMVDVFGEALAVPPCNPEFPPPQDAEDDADSEEGAGGSEDASGDSGDGAAPATPVPTEALPPAFDRELFCKDPRTVMVDTDYDPVHGYVHEVQPPDVLVRRLGSCRMVGISSVKLQCSVCKFSASGDLIVCFVFLPCV